MEQQRITLRDLYPDFTPEQFEEAEGNLERFLAVFARLAERLRAEGFDLSDPDLTALATEASIPHARVESPASASQPTPHP